MELTNKILGSNFDETNSMLSCWNFNISMDYISHINDIIKKILYIMIYDIVMDYDPTLVDKLT